MSEHHGPEWPDGPEGIRRAIAVLELRLIDERDPEIDALLRRSRAVLERELNRPR